MLYLAKLARRLARIRAAIIPGVLLLAACQAGDSQDFLAPPPLTVLPATSLRVQPAVVTVKAGDLVQFSAVGVNSRGEVVDVVVDWSASSGTILPDGRYTGSQSGRATITAKLRGQPAVSESAVAGIWVGPTDVLAVAVFPESTVVQEGETLSLEAIGQTAGGNAASLPTVSWTASGGTVTAGGDFTAPSEGFYTIKAVASNGVWGSSSVKVQRRNRTLQSLNLTPATAALTTGGTQQFTAMGTWSDSSSSEADVVWAATGGSINGTGVYRAGSTPGTFRVISRQKQGTIADTSIVTISAPSVTGVTVLPGIAALAPGATQEFSASAAMSDGSTTAPAMTWTATGGSVTSGGAFTAGSNPGTYRLIGKVAGGTAADTSTITVAQPPTTLTEFTVSPASVSVAAGTSHQFTVTARWSDGSTTVPALAWTATGGSVSSGGTYSAGNTQGTFRVIVSAAGRADTSAVTITAPALRSLVLNPSDASTAPNGTLQFTVSGTSTVGTSSTPQVAWTVAGGTMSVSGLFQAGSTPGVYRVIANEVGGTLADTSLVTISAAAPSLVSLSISPASVSLVPLTGKQFSGTATWSDGSTTVPAITWAGSGGSMTQAGYYTAGQTGGTYKVIAAASGKADTSIVTISAPKTLTALTMTPGSTSLTAGATKQFSTAGVWSDGSTTPPLVTWSATGGVVSSGGLYTAGQTSGTYLVIAQHTGGTLADTATVSVSGGTATPTLTGLELTPASATVFTGGSQQFSATGRLSNGATQTVTVSWSASGGTVSSNGLFTAGTALGIFRVIATQQGGTLADTAFVTVVTASTTYQALMSDAWSGYTGDTQVRTAYSGAKGSIWSFGTVDWGKVNLVADPIFGKALRIPQPQQTPFYDLVKYPDGMPGATYLMRVTLPTGLDGVWVRARFKFAYDAAKQPTGWLTKSPNDPSPWGGSYKLFFLRWASPYSERGSLVYTNTKRLDFEYYISGQNRTATTVGGKAGTSGAMNDLGAPEFTDGEWYEFVFFHRKTGSMTSRGGSWVRRLTTGRGTQQSPAAWNWVLKDYAWSVAAPVPREIEFGGNKNHGNEFEQWVVWGPYEIVDPAKYPNPFGVPMS